MPYFVQVLGGLPFESLLQCKVRLSHADPEASSMPIKNQKPIWLYQRKKWDCKWDSIGLRGNNNLLVPPSLNSLHGQPFHLAQSELPARWQSPLYWLSFAQLPSFASFPLSAVEGERWDIHQWQRKTGGNYHLANPLLVSVKPQANILKPSCT